MLYTRNNTTNMNTLIKKLSILSDIKLKKYYETADLTELHTLKLYLDDKYHNLGETTGFDDWQYDLLYLILFMRDPDYVAPIGAKIRDGENKTTLPFYMGSMDKIKPEDTGKIARWITAYKSSEYILEDKLDGVSCLITIDGNSIKLYTRGDGTVGSDITAMAGQFASIPKKYPTGTKIAVRGELIIKKQVFLDKYAQQYANPRNMVAGIVGGKKIREGLRDVEFVAYELVTTGVSPKPTEQFEYLRSLGFQTVYTELIKAITIDDLMFFLVKRRKESPYEIDGIIVQANTPYTRNTSGNPDYAFAFKIRLNGVNTTVVGVDWNVSKWGKLKPRVELTPVQLQGVTITYATGFNGKYIQDNLIGPGAVVHITRSGEVIPYIVEVITPAKEADMPEGDYVWNDTYVDIITTGDNDDMCIKLISYFLAAIDAKNVGEARVRKMYERGFDNLPKILSVTREELDKIPGFAAEQTYNGIQRGRSNITVINAIGASGILGLGIGTRKVKALLDAIPNLLEIYKTMSINDLTNVIIGVDGFAHITARKVALNLKYADQFIQLLRSIGIQFKTVQTTGNAMSGQKVVFTGFRDPVLAQAIVDQGGEVQSNTTKTTTILITKTDNPEITGKLKKAQDQGIRIMSVTAFKQEFFRDMI